MNYFRQTSFYRLLMYGALAQLVGSALILAFDQDHPTRRGYAVVAGLIAIGFLILHVVSLGGERLDMRLMRELRRRTLKNLSVLNKTFPAYRFVDIYRAAERYAVRFPTTVVVESLHAEDLNSIVNGMFYGEQSGRIKQPPNVPRDVAWHKEEFFPTDRFWVVQPGGPRSHDDLPAVAVLRVRILDYSNDAMLEVAADDRSAAEAVTEHIVQDSIEHSIYRNSLLQISFESGVKDEYGDVDHSGGFQLAFKQRKQVTAEQIILDDDVHGMLNRNVFDFHRRREQLQKVGVPTKKGLLFYGPPGTGKTYCCQYIYSNLTNVSTLIVTGQSLLHVKTICNLARMLQPSLVVLEDVDLIFASREINLYSTALGDLMDELDGFQNDEPVMFLLTTNAIERLEQAIKDRPGRINQCIYFGPPNGDLRKRYIRRYLEPYNAAELDLDRIVADTKDSSQAFIKELIYRAVQVGMEDPSRNGQDVRLQDADFESALSEMTRFAEKATGSIMGFRVDG